LWCAHTTYCPAVGGTSHPVPGRSSPVGNVGARRAAIRRRHTRYRAVCTVEWQMASVPFDRPAAPASPTGVVDTAATPGPARPRTPYVLICMSGPPCPSRRTTVMPTSWLCRPRRWIACSVRDLRRRGRHSPRPIVGREVGRDRDRDAEDGGMAVVGIHIRRTLQLPRRWDSRAVCLSRARRWGQGEALRRLRLKPLVHARETVGLCRPREPESPAPQGNPRPRRHNDG